MPEGYTANEVAQIRENIRVAGGLSGFNFSNSALLGNPMIQLFLGYASARAGEEFIALAHFEIAEFHAYERNYCNKKIVRELSSIGRFEAITHLEKEFTNNEYFLSLAYGITFPPISMSIMTFEKMECTLFSIDIEIMMSDTINERIYSIPECKGR